MAEQLSVFVDNRPGQLNAITGILRDHRINIRAMTMADHRDYGVAKLLVNDPRLAHRALVEQGFAAALKPVLAIAIEDQPGGLHELLVVQRWQGLPKQAGAPGPTMHTQHVKVSELPKVLPAGMAKVTPEQRREQLERRRRAYARRLVDH